jgi:hypothetical protein
VNYTWHSIQLAEDQAMTKEPEGRRIPQWLTIDLLVIVLPIGIIGLAAWIAP